MPRMSKKRRLEWSFFLNHRNRITYNDLCRGYRGTLPPVLLQTLEKGGHRQWQITANITTSS